MNNEEEKKPELPTETGQRTTVKSTKKTGQTVPPVKMTEQQLFEAEQQRIAAAYALVQQNEKRNQEIKEQCWQEIQDVAAKYGLQISLGYHPVNVTIDLIALQGA